MRRLLASIPLGLLALLLFAMPVGAGVSWCRADPIVRLGDDVYQIIVSVPEHNVKQIDDQLLFEVYSPKSVAQELLYLDAGFNGHGERVDFKRHSKQQHTINLDVKHNDDKFPVLVEVYRNGELYQTVEGTSDVIWMHLPLD